MSDGSADFALKATDETSGAADSAANALVRLSDKISGTESEIRSLQTAMKAMKAGGESKLDTKTFEEMQTRVKAARAELSEAQVQFAKMGGSAFEVKKIRDALREEENQAKKTAKAEDDLAKKTTKALKEEESQAKKTAKAEDELAKKTTKAHQEAEKKKEEAQRGSLAAMKAGLGPLGGIFEKVELMKTAMGGLGTGGALAAGGAALAAVAFVALTAAVIAAWVEIGKLTVEILKFAVGTADAARTVGLMREGFTGSAAKANELGNLIALVSTTLPIASSEVEKLAADLYKAGKRGSELEEALFQASMKAIGMDKAPIGAIQKRMLSLDVQTMKLKEHFAKLFANMNIDPLLEGLKSIVDLFDQNTASGQALRQLVDTLLQPLIDDIAAVAPIAKNLFRGMVIGALLAAIGVLKLRDAIAEVIPAEALTAMKAFMGSTDMVWAAVDIGVAIVALLVVGMGLLIITTIILTGIFALWAVGALLAAACLFGPLLIAIGLVIAAVLIMAFILALPFIALALLVAGFAVAAYYLLGFAETAGEAASGIIDGLVGGISGGAGMVMDAIRALGTGAMNALKSVLGIHSPSTVFAGLGDFTAAGFAEGIEAGSPAVEDAAGGMADAAVGEATGGAGRRAGGAAGGGGAASGRSNETVSRNSRNGPQITVQTLIVHAQSNEPEDFAQRVMNALLDLGEGHAEATGHDLELEPV